MRKLTLVAVCLILALVLGYHRLHQQRGIGSGGAATGLKKAKAHEAAPRPEANPAGADNAKEEIREELMYGAAPSAKDPEEESNSNAALDTPDAEEDTPPPMRTASVSGYVMDQEAKPIAGAQVSLLLNDALYTFDAAHIHTTYTDELGRFSVQGSGFAEDAGIVHLKVQARGFTSTHKQLAIPQDGTIDGVVILLRERETFEGRLLTQDGVPIAGAFMSIRGMIMRLEDPHGTGLFLDMGKTDQDGRFSLGWRHEGSSTLHMFSTTHGRTVFVGVPMDRDEVVELRMPVFASLAGRITGRNGAPASGLAVKAEGRPYARGSASIYRVATMNARGEYKFTSLPPNLHYAVRILSEEGTPLSHAVDLGLLNPGEARRWDYALAKASTVSVSVVGEQSHRPLTGMRICYLRGVEPQLSAGIEAGRIDDEGRLDFELFERGPYLIFPERSLNVPWESAEVYGQRVDVGSGTHYTLEFVLPDSIPRSVRVVNHQGKPIVRAKVKSLMRMADGTTERIGQGYTDWDGRHSWPAVPVGMPVWFEIELRGYTPATTPEVVGEMGVSYEEETVVLHGLAGIEGVLIGPGNLPLRNRLFEYRLDYQAVTGKATTDAQGVFLIPEDIPATRCCFIFTTKTKEGLSLVGAACPVECEADVYTDLGHIDMQVIPEGASDTQ